MNTEREAFSLREGEEEGRKGKKAGGRVGEDGMRKRENKRKARCGVRTDSGEGRGGGGSAGRKGPQHPLPQLPQSHRQ